MLCMVSDLASLASACREPSLDQLLQEDLHLKGPKLKKTSSSKHPNNSKTPHPHLLQPIVSLLLSSYRSKWSLDLHHWCSHFSALSLYWSLMNYSSWSILNSIASWSSLERFHVSLATSLLRLLSILEIPSEIVGCCISMLSLLKYLD